MTDLTREQLDRNIATTPPSDLRTALEMARRSLDLAEQLREAEALLDWQGAPTYSGEEYLDELRAYRAKWGSHG